jgi:hypothetical protein
MPILSLALTAALLILLFFGVYQLLRRFEGEAGSGPDAGEREGSRAAVPVKRPGAPPAITLSPYTGKRDHFALNHEALEAHQAIIGKGGMNRVGDFTINEMPGYFIRAFSHPERNLTALIYRDPAGKTWLNLQTEYADGRIITTTSMEKGAVPQPRPMGMPIYHHPNLSTEQLLRRHKLETRAVEQAPPPPPENFAEKFSANYARLRESAQDIQESGPSQKPEAAPAPIEPAEGTPASVDEDIFREAATPAAAEEDLSPSMEQIRKWLAMIFQKLRIPPARRDAFVKGLVWISERGSREAVIGAINEYSGVTVEAAPGERLVIRSGGGAEDIVDAAGLLGLALFEKVNSRLPEGSRFTRLPVNAEGVAFFARKEPDVHD